MAEFLRMDLPDAQAERFYALKYRSHKGELPPSYKHGKTWQIIPSNLANCLGAQRILRYLWRKYFLTALGPSE